MPMTWDLQKDIYIYLVTAAHRVSSKCPHLTPMWSFFSSKRTFSTLDSGVDRCFFTAFNLTANFFLILRWLFFFFFFSLNGGWSFSRFLFFQIKWCTAPLKTWLPVCVVSFFRCKWQSCMYLQRAGRMEHTGKDRFWYLL